MEKHHVKTSFLSSWDISLTKSVVAIIGQAKMPILGTPNLCDEAQVVLINIHHFFLLANIRTITTMMKMLLC